MTKQQEVAKSDSCFNRAGDDELIFVLRGKDKAASAAIRAWAVKRIDLGMNEPNDPWILEALDVAFQIDARLNLA